MTGGPPGWEHVTIADPTPLVGQNLGVGPGNLFEPALPVIPMVRGVFEKQTWEWHQQTLILRPGKTL